MRVIFYFYPFLAIVLWAGNVIVSRLAATAIAPAAITFYRLLLVLLVMTPFMVKPLWANRLQIRKNFWKLALGGFMSMVLFQSLSYRAAESTTATNMAIVTALIPLLTAILTTLLLREPVTVGMVAGGVVSFCGLLYVVGQGSVGAMLQHGVHAGDGLMLGAAFSFSLYGVLLRRWRMTVPAWQAIYVQAVSASILMLPFFLRLPSGTANLDGTTLPLIIYAGLGSSIALSFFWIEGIKHLGPNRCSIFINLLPVLTALLAIVWLGESLHIYHVIGGGLTLIGVLLAQLLHRPIFVLRPQYRP